MMAVDEQTASRLHSVNEDWVTFFQEAVIDPDPEDRSRILQMFFDLLDRWRTRKDRERKQLRIDIPRPVYDWLKNRHTKEGYPTFNRYLVTRLLQGALNNGEEL